MKLEDLIGILIPATFLVMLAVEAWRPARGYPKIRAWRGVGLLFLVLILALNTLLPLLLPVEWLASHRLVDGTRLGLVGGTVVGYLVLSLANALWHRAEHNVLVLWRFFHQFHHSPVRLDLSGGVYFSPLDILANGTLSFAVTVFLLGLTPEAAALTGFVAVFYGLFQHWNVRTPPWLGYVIQRPESHGVHHARGVHGLNYSDFPLWDILFGSFRNPARFEGEVGFGGDAPRRRLAMLLGADVDPASTGASIGTERVRELAAAS